MSEDGLWVDFLGEVVADLVEDHLVDLALPAEEEGDVPGGADEGLHVLLRVSVEEEVYGLVFGLHSEIFSELLEACEAVDHPDLVVVYPVGVLLGQCLSELGVFVSDDAEWLVHHDGPFVPPLGLHPAEVEAAFEGGVGLVDVAEVKVKPFGHELTAFLGCDEGDLQGELPLHFRVDVRVDLPVQVAAFQGVEVEYHFGEAAEPVVDVLGWEAADVEQPVEVGDGDGKGL